MFHLNVYPNLGKPQNSSFPREHRLPNLDNTYPNTHPKALATGTECVTRLENVQKTSRAPKSQPISSSKLKKNVQQKKIAKQQQNKTKWQQCRHIAQPARSIFPPISTSCNKIGRASCRERVCHRV